MQTMLGVHWHDPTPDQMLSWGGSLAARTLTGEYWRLFTSMFVHFGVMHLLANMYMLAIAGPRAERRFGIPAFLVIYLFGGLFGGLLSAWWQGGNMVKTVPSLTAFGIVHREQVVLVVSAGASAAIMALCSALLVARQLQHGPVHSGADGMEDSGFNKALAQVVGINLIMGFVIPGVDQAGHIGGLTVGALLGAVFANALQAASPRRLLRAMFALLVGIGLLWGGLRLGDRSELRDVRKQLDREASGEVAAPD
jgi:rhomboid protease GluP